MICKNCNSVNTQKLSLIYESRKNNIFKSSKNIGVGMATRGIGIASAITSGIAQSILIQKLSPPKKNSYLVAVLVMIIAVILLYNTNELSLKNVVFGLIGIFLLGFGIKIFKVNYRYNAITFPKKYLVWAKSWHCNNCGNIYSV